MFLTFMSVQFFQVRFAVTEQSGCPIVHFDILQDCQRLRFGAVAVSRLSISRLRLRFQQRATFARGVYEYIQRRMWDVAYCG